MKLALTLLLGAVLGALAHALFGPVAATRTVEHAPLDPHGEAPALASEVDSSLPTARGGDDRVVDPDPPAPSPSPSGERREAEGVLFSEALLAHHDTQYLRGWSEIRARPVEPSPALVAGAEAGFRERVLGLSERLGAKDAEQANETDALALSLETLDVAALLQFARDEIWIPDETFPTSERFAELWTPRTAGANLDGPGFVSGREAELTPGATLVFGPGIHVLDARRLQAENGVIPADVTLVGAGKDATLLRIGDISTRGFLERLTLRDMTLDADNDGLFDIRSVTALVDLQRVRIVRFDAGHGGCNTLSASRGAIFRARDVDFVGGYGRSPGNGDLLDGAPIIALFQNCRFERIKMRDLTPGDGSQVRFQDCRFVTEWNPIQPQPGLAFERCQYEELEPTEIETLPLSDLFPGAE